ncbi:Methyltransferase SCO0408 [Candidatus Rhodobacter oscarellae]|uniref:Methyltransferase SCO0408 n=1 Tax=Candidatus Rhodobacter oscarellae TaxID=1675527 RepID=A0A0J9E5I8_9RHOB|nr:class I SAM-dependent methyltransferase [Candidatus Rhodobacter lobularis]KMW58030.1 Methyltransferase SCO0408 [Candidatus Rhodobacter lobularis]
MQDDGYFGEAVAARYDQNHAGVDPLVLARSVDVLFDLAAGAPALEFAIGTGRVALPLAAKGCAVSGIELSAAMLAELRKKETGTPLNVTLGDMTTARVPGQFGLVYLVYNTIDNLCTQAAQVACFGNAAAHLAPGGRFLIETLVPPLQKIPFGEDKLVTDASDDHICIDAFDVVTQSYSSRHVWMQGQGARVSQIPFRYAWPAELDLMAQMAGMVLEHRWADWARAPFTAQSESHISVWRKA